MKNIYKMKFIVTFLVFVLISAFSFGQCTHSICLLDTYGDGWNGGSVTVNVGGVNVISGATLSSGYGPSCYNFSVTTGQTITVTYTAGSWSYENYYIVYNNAGGSGTTLYNSGSGSTPPTSHAVTANCTGGGGLPASTCVDALPFCTSDAYTFPASTNVPSMGSVGCLYTTPNPAWYWMEIGNPGNIDIYMSSGGDVDFIAWGPFTSLAAACATNLMSNSGVDCSYSTAAQETANLTNTQTGQVYVLLITNYANIVTNISFSQTGGAGSTNCGIIAPPITNNGPLCAGQTLQLTVSNPVAGATYMWSGPNGWSSTTMNPTITNVTTANAGTYSLAITVGTETSPPVTTDVVINPNVTPTFNAVGPYCSGASISALPTTSTNSITGTWSPAINNTATTTYTFTPSAGQCANTTTMGITINPNVTPTFTSVGPYCAGTSIPALPTTSNNGITGTWSPAINNSTTTSYTFTPTAGQCAVTTSMSITITPLTTPTFTAVGPYCSGATISALPTTSNNGITGTWSPAINNTATTTYTFTPTAGQCANTTTMTITINPNVTPTFTVPGPYCSGASVPALPTTSTNGVTGSWSPAINNSATTTYTFTPTAGVCATSTSITVIVNDNLLPTFNPVGPYCYGTTIPSLPTTSLNGVSGTWSPAINNTATTTYTFTPSAGQCATSTSLSIEIGFLETEVISTTNQFCDAYGTATISGLGGTEPYNYSWPSPATGTIGGTASNLTAGNYIVSISDAVGCQATQSFTIGFTDNMQVTANVSSNPLCYGDANGSANVNITHGTGPFNVNWGVNSAYTGLTNYSISGLSSGNYYITVTDVNGCNDTVMVNLSNPPQLVASATYTQIACSGESATVTVTATGGTPSYSGTGTFTVPAGTYNYTVTDSHVCQSVASVTVPVAPAPVSIYASVSNVTCFGASDGSISITTSGGTSPYYYQWSNFLPQSHITGLSAGQYSVTVHDYNDCSVTGTYTITEPEEMKLDFTSTDLSCYGEANGSVQMVAEGGHPPYTFEMYNDRYNGNGAYQRNLSEGHYTIFVRDANGCTKTRNILILSPAELQVSLVSTNPSCIGNDDGSVVVYVSGGTEPYTYVFEDIFFPDNNITSLREGDYSLEIIDANNCNKRINSVKLVDNPYDCIAIPNAFTPNGDGINDTWIIDGIDKFPQSVTQVFNRWGQTVYYGYPDDDPWDGNFSGKLVPSGTYVFFLNLFNGQAIYKGTVNVIY